MADGHSSSCATATIGSVCHCECSGARHAYSLLMEALGNPDGAKNKAASGDSGSPSASSPKVEPEPQIPPDATNAEPDDARDQSPPAPTFDERAAAARTGRDAREAAPVSLNRRDDLNDREADGLDAYLDEEYRPINHLLRGGDPADLPRWYTNEAEARAWIDGVDEAMARSPLAEEVQTWRGLQSGRVIFGDNLDGDLTGAEWTEQAYVSTSSDVNVSRGFASGGDDRNERVLMRIVTPAGTRAIELSGEEFESELLLDRGLRMRVVADRGRDGTGLRHLDIEVLPRDPNG